jgi:hydroxyacylglutathione hydrolase
MENLIPEGNLIYRKKGYVDAKGEKMIFEKIVSEGLAHNSYLIGSGSVAAIIDPRRDIDVYLNRLRKKNLLLKYIFETHRNEDYLVGSLDLARMTGAEIYHGTRYKFGYGKGVKEGVTFALGTLEIEIRETPGHTEESISLVVRESTMPDDALLVFTGDALFAGDVGRTDFYPDRMDQMAGALYDSIWEKILTLGDGVAVFPAHGEGSVCGEAISDRDITTTGYERKTNPLLRMNREEFVQYKVKEHHYYPPYFHRMEVANTNGAPSLLQVPVLTPISVQEIRSYREKGAQLVDIRAPTCFGGGYIQGSVSIWREGLPSFIGWMLDDKNPIILIDDFNLKLEQVIRMFLREGYDNLIGYLQGGFSAWNKAGEEMGVIPQWTPRKLAERMQDSLFILDVRNVVDREEAGHIPGSRHRYIGELRENLHEVPKDRQIVTYCDGGFKGNMAATILHNQGFSVANLSGGIAGWKNQKLPLEK